tara:strand:- start:593 stop:946 length:354 start_codon:yes stop_codon:yes gene_type:complete
VKHFSLDEFDSPDLPNSGINMDKSFLEKLDLAREYAGIPFKITSGYRSKDHNKKIGGVENSSHLIGVAADIAVSNNSERGIILSSLIKAGFKRVGIANGFLHCDTDESKPNSFWLYS